MFFEENQVNEALNCPICLKRYDTPYNVPCGNCVCHKCLSTIILVLDENSNEYECSLCNDYHVYPKKGFPTNKSLIKILKEQPSEVYRGKMIEDLKVILKEIQSKRKEFEYLLNNGLEKISETCLEMRTDVQLATESAILRINELSEAMLKEIGEYEKECVNSFHANKINKDEFALFIKELDDFHHYWNENLKKLILSEDEIAKSCELAKALKKRMYKEAKNLAKFIF